MFPAYAGVIPVKSTSIDPSAGVPRVCGGDPIDTLAACTGLSVPRVCGGDPVYEITQLFRIGCSPRMRG